MKIKEKIKGDLIKGFVNAELMDMIKENALPYRKLMSYYRCAMMEIETKFNVLNDQFSLQYERNPIESIKTRLKSPESLLRKLRKKDLPVTIESVEDNIYDVAGIRVICSFIEDIYNLAECLLRQDDIKLIEIKDYIKEPKKSGYRSLHLIVEVPIFLEDEKKLVKAEVQLRTIAMDFWASLEHKLQYKKEIAPEEAASISENLAECAEAISDLDARMEEIKNRIVKIK
ncbi:MAG: GTP pyrophosphokinase family protein [Clostridiales bacterium]|nr:GTP pyrophosphokinase family protein [Clostridiales bacterium]